MTNDDHWHMSTALALAVRGLGRTWPNPAVGCVLVQPDGGGRVVGRGWTQAGGRPHAETEAIRRAGASARGATAYVTLEPCAHHGATPPCADALIAAGVARAVIAIEDPFSKVAGQGIARLKAAGVAVSLGVRATDATAVNAGFLMRLKLGRPHVTLKTATTLDGRIAAASGDSKWITGEEARRHAHLLRASFDVVLTGSGTVAADDPLLTCRLPGLEDRSPVRVIADSALRTPAAARIVETALGTPTWILTGAGANSARRKALEAKGVEVIEVARGDDGRPDPEAALRLLGERGITRLLVESGGTLAAALLKADLIDAILWFRAALVLGGDALPAFAALGVREVAAAHRFARGKIVSFGDDVLETYVKRP